MQTVHYVIMVIGALITGLLAASHLLPPSVSLWIVVGATIATPVLTTLGLTSNSAVNSGSASAQAVAGELLAAPAAAPVTVNVHPPTPAPASPDATVKP